MVMADDVTAPISVKEFAPMTMGHLRRWLGCASVSRLWKEGSRDVIGVRTPASPAQSDSWGEVRKGGGAPLRVP